MLTLSTGRTDSFILLCLLDYDCDYDTGINVIEGGAVTLTSPATDSWCFPSDWADANPTSICSNAAGSAAVPYHYWNGCSGQFHQIFPNASQFQWAPSGPGNDNYDNSGCNSDSDMQAPTGAVAFRIGVDTTSMQNAHYIPIEYHSFDYYYAFPSNASSGTLTNTFTAPNTGRLYLAFQGPGSGPRSYYSGAVRVSASYTPPAGLVLGLNWSPSPANVAQPYLFNAPTSNTTSALAAVGLVPSTAPRYLPIPDNFASTAGPINVTFTIYQTLFTQTAALLSLIAQPLAAWSQRSYVGFAQFNGFQNYATTSGVVSLQNPFIVFGGQVKINGVWNGLDDVWASTDMINWSLVSGTTIEHQSANPTTFTALEGQMTCADNARGILYIFGGAAGNSDTSGTSTISVSRNGGQSFNTSVGPWPGKFNGLCVVDQMTGGVYVIAGKEDSSSGSNVTNDVYRSLDFGVTWTRQTPSAPWLPRDSPAGVVSYSPTFQASLLYVGTGYYYQSGTVEQAYDNGQSAADLWVSSDGGVTWGAVTLQAPFPPRDHSRLLATPQGALLIVQGDMQPPIIANGSDEANGGNDFYPNDLWASLDGGVTWGNCSGTLPVGRRGIGAVLDPNGFLVVGGGDVVGPTFFNDVYRSSISFFNPSLIGDACGLSVPTTIGLTTYPLTVNSAQYQWCAVFYGAPGELDYPWAAVYNGTLTASTQQFNSSKYNASYSVVSFFTGTRNYTNRYGDNLINTLQLAYTIDAGLAPYFADQYLFTNAPFLDGNGITFDLNGYVEVQGAMYANQINLYYSASDLLNGVYYVTESIANSTVVNGIHVDIANTGNQVNNDPSRTVFASNIPGWQGVAYSQQACTASIATVPFVIIPAGIYAYTLNYFISDGYAYMTKANLTIYTDGSVYTDQLGNQYFSVMAVTGTRTYTYINASPNVVFTASPVAVIPVRYDASGGNDFNNNRFYPQYPYLDRQGFAYELSQNVPIDGGNNAWSTSSNIINPLVYRLNEFEEGNVVSGSPSHYPLPQLQYVSSSNATVPNTLSIIQFCLIINSIANTLDYPAASVLSGTALVNSTSSATTYNLVGFEGIRTFYNRYGQNYSVNVQLGAPGEENAVNVLYTISPYLPSYINFRLSSYTLFPGALLANEYDVGSGWDERVQYNFQGESNNERASSAQYYSTLPGLTNSTFTASSVAVTVAPLTSMATQCQPTVLMSSTAYNWSAPTLPAAGVATFLYSYTLPDPSGTVTAWVLLYTDGSVNVDVLGNTYYRLIAARGNRTYVQTSTNTTYFGNITALIPAGSVQTSDGTVYTDNYLYSQIPYLDRHGFGYETSVYFPNPAFFQSGSAQLGPNQTVNVFNPLIYRLTPAGLEEGNSLGNFAQSVYFTVSAPSSSLIQLTTPATYQTVSFCYVAYGGPGTLDYPWSSVISGTGLIDSSVTVTSRNQSGYQLIGFTGTRTYTNRYNQQTVTNITLAAYAEDGGYNDAVIYTTVPYIDTNGLVFRLSRNTSFPGGLFGNIDNIFNDKVYPNGSIVYAESPGTTAGTRGQYVVSSQRSPFVDVSRQRIITTIPGFTGSTDMTQCVASFATQSAPNYAAGTYTFNWNYNVTDNSKYIIAVSAFVVGDGSVQTDALGNTFTVAAYISGTRTITNLTTQQVFTSTITGLLPYHSLPTNSFYVNTNRFYFAYPYLDSTGLAYSFQTMPEPANNLLTYSAVNVFTYINGYTAATYYESPYATNTVTANTTINATYTFVPTTGTTISFSWCYNVYSAPNAVGGLWTIGYSGTVTALAQLFLAGPQNEFYVAPIPYYVALSFTGIRTYTSLSGSSSTAVRLIPVAGIPTSNFDNLFYTQAPYSDANGIDFALTSIQSVPGSSSTIASDYVYYSVDSGFLYQVPADAAVVGSTDFSRTTVISNMPGFLGNTNLSQCLIPVTPYSGSGNICVLIQGAAGSGPWSAGGTSGWTAILQASVTYSTPYGLNTFTDDSLGSYITLNSVVNGSISIYSPFVNPATGNQAVVTASISGLANVGSNSVSNVIYNSYSASIPFDKSGIGFLLASGIEFPGQSGTHVSSFIDLYFAMDPVTGARYPAIQGFGDSAESATFITDLPGVPSAFVAPSGSNLNSPSGCTNAFSASTTAMIGSAISAPSQPAISTLVTISYNISDNLSYVIRVVLNGAVVQSGATDVYGVSHSVITVTSGSRYYGYGTPANNFTSSTVTSTVNAAACLTANQYFYADPSQYPYLDASGIQYAVRPTQPLVGLPATTASRKSTAFTVYADPTTGLLREIPSATQSVSTSSSITFHY